MHVASVVGWKPGETPTVADGLQIKALAAGRTVRATLPAFFPSDDKPWGWQFSDQWNAYGKWMYDQHLIKHLAARDFASTNQLLAGQGP